MLSTSNSAVDSRRRTHRRQNSMPVTELPYLAPAHPGLQRAHQARGHRRGLSLDNHRSTYQPARRMVQTLGPISQDDLSVSITNQPGHQSALQHHPLQFAQQHELVQPGHYHMEAPFELQQSFTPSLDVEQQSFFHPHDTRNFHPAETHSFAHLTPSPHMLQPSNFQNQMLSPANEVPAQQHFDEAKRRLEAVFPGAQINIQVLPTPVSTPQKRASIAPPEKLDISPIPFNVHDNPELRLDNSQAMHMFEVQGLDHSEPGPEYTSPIHSPVALSPTHSLLRSPQLMNAMSPSQASTLLEVEGESAGDMLSPGARPVSFADLSVTDMKGAFVTTGVAPEAVDKYISPQDPATKKYYCMFEGCLKNEGFGRRENIRAHVQTHLNDRAYKCLVCNSAFVRMNDLKRHSKIHKSTKEFQCECGSMFARHDALTRHKQRGCCTVHSSPLKPGRKKPGRPKKHRPELEDRVAKSSKQRQLNAQKDTCEGSAGHSSDEEYSPAPSPRIAHAEFASLDEAALHSQLESQLETQLTSGTEFEEPRSPSPLPDTVPGSTLSFQDYTINPTDISVNTAFDMSNLDNAQADTSYGFDNCSAPTFSSSVFKYFGGSGVSGLGIKHTTPPPDTPDAKRNPNNEPELQKASPAHSLMSASLSTPPSSPPELSLPQPSFDEDGRGFWDFMGHSHLETMHAKTRAEWDAVDMDLFGEELPGQHQSSGDDFFDLTYG